MNDSFSVSVSLSDSVSVRDVLSVVPCVSVIELLTPFCTPALAPTLTPTVADELILSFSVLWKLVDHDAYGANPE